MGEQTPNSRDEQTSNSKVIDTAYTIDDIPPEHRDEMVKGFYRTKDKNIAAYLKARGFSYRGWERVRLVQQRKEVTVFCFDGQNVTRRTILEYYNNVEKSNWNVNAKLMLEELQNINSIISNW
jgi:hypothetical protein